MLARLVLAGLFVLFVPASAHPAPRAVGYYTSWSVYARAFQVADIPAADLTHVNYAFADVSPAGECVLFDPFADVQQPYAGDGGGPVRGNFRQLQILKAQYPALRTLISVGGWTLSAHFSDAAATAASRQHFAASCVQFMHDYGFDGIDIDWEFPVSGGLETNTTRPEDTQNFTLLLAELRAQLDARATLDGRPYLLTIAAPAAPAVRANLDMGALHPFVDWIAIMAYDFAGPWSPLTHFHAMLHAPSDDPAFEPDDPSGDAAVQAYVAGGVPRDKVVLGLPLYGRGWSGVAAANDGLYQPYTGIPAGTYEAGVFDWRDLAANYLGTSFQRHWHPEALAPWLYDPASAVMISYDDPESIAAKAAYVDQQQLGGLMMWELAMDDDAHSLVGAVGSGLAAVCDPTPRAGCDAAGKSSLTVTHGKLGWSFQKGGAGRVLADFGAPTTTTTYTVCLYDGGARVWQAKVAPGAAWRQSGAAGYTYKAKDGITRIGLEGGLAGKPSVRVQGRGAAVATLPTPLGQPVDVTVQLMNDANANCWSDRYTVARSNVPGTFKAANR